MKRKEKRKFTSNSDSDNLRRVLRVVSGLQSSVRAYDSLFITFPFPSTPEVEFGRTLTFKIGDCLRRRLNEYGFRLGLWDCTLASSSSGFCEICASEYPRGHL